jgi:hypothetical protein
MDQRPASVAQILEKVVKVVDAAHVAAFLLDLCKATDPAKLRVLRFVRGACPAAAP